MAIYPRKYKDYTKKMNQSTFVPHTIKDKDNRQAEASILLFFINTKRTFDTIS